MPATQRFDVDGEAFDVTQHASAPGRYHFAWTSGRNRGYGFTANTSDNRAMTQDQIVSQIRSFLAQVDPDTGYLAD